MKLLVSRGITRGNFYSREILLEFLNEGGAEFLRTTETFQLEEEKNRECVKQLRVLARVSIESEKCEREFDERSTEFLKTTGIS